MNRRVVLFWKILYCVSVARTMTDIEVDQRIHENGDSSPNPYFTWTSPFSLHVLFPNRNEDDIGLQPVHIAGKPVKCLFRGLFYRDSSASAVISGCMEDEIITITIISRALWGRTAFEINKGFVDEQENPYANNPDFESDYVEVNSRQKRSIYEDYEEYDYTEIIYDSAHDNNSPVPHLLTTTVKLAFDRSLKEKCGTEEAARAYVRSVAEHGSIYLQNFSPDTKIFLNFWDEIEFVNKTWKPTAIDLREAFLVKQPEAIPLVIFCSTDDSDNYMGVSAGLPGKACDTEKGVSLVKHRSKKNIAAMSFAHEIGHLHGMRHDHREDPLCHGSGLMSEIRPDLSPSQRPETFSSCSVSRFNRWFRNYGINCMEEGIVNKDSKLKYLDETCNSVVASPGESLHSGCQKPEDLKNGIWMCSIDGATCNAVCIPGYKLVHAKQNSFIECFHKIWIESHNNFLCEINPQYKPPVFYRVSSTGEAGQQRSFCMGDYYPTRQYVNHFPIFQKGTHYLFVETDFGQWLIGPTAGANDGWINHPAYWVYPTPSVPPVNGWQFNKEFNKDYSSWTPDNSITVVGIPKL